MKASTIVKGVKYSTGLFIFLLTAELYSAPAKDTKKSGNAQLFPQKPSIEEVVHFVLKNNTQTQIQRLEIAKSDTEIIKLNSIYNPKVYFDATKYRKRDPEEFASPLQGNEVQQEVMAVGVNKMLTTGTYVGLEYADTKVDTNAGESPLNYMIYGEVAFFMQQPAIHTGALTVTLSQELLKDGFGYNQRRQQDIARNNSMIQREQLTFQLSQLVVKAMVDYWNLAVQEDNLETMYLLNKNIADIRNITRKKMGFGLSESFQLNQWNALLAQSEISTNNALKSRNAAQREFLKVMNLPEDYSISMTQNLRETVPNDIDLEKDIDHALKTRPDIKNIRLQEKNAELARDMAENNMLPSVTVNGRYSYRDQSLQPYPHRDIPNRTWPESSIQVRVEYPLWDEGNKVDVRNANLSLRQLKIQREETTRTVRNDLQNAHEDIITSHKALQKAKYAVDQTEAFYANIIRGYRQGRFNADTVKQALDALFQARFSRLQAKIGFNIALVNYDMKSNRLWDKYNVDIDRYIDSLSTRF